MHDDLQVGIVASQVDGKTVDVTPGVLACPARHHGNDFYFHIRVKVRAKRVNGQFYSIHEDSHVRSHKLSFLQALKHNALTSTIVNNYYIRF